MGKPTTFWGPVLRVLQRQSNPAAAGFPLNAAPGMEFLLSGLQDHRLPYNSRGSSPNQPGVLGWYAGGPIMVANLVPAAPATANIAALANVVNGTAMALVGASGAGIVVPSAGSPATFQPSGLVLTGGAAIIDAAPSLASFGANGDFNTSFFNRSTCVGRCVSITGVAGGAGGAFLVQGYDTYGYPMSQQITVAAGANTVNSTKAFKAVTSVTPKFTDAHNYSVGVADIFGLGLLASFWGDVDVTWNSASVTASTGFTPADVTSPATTTTGDVRGTYAVQSASDGTKRLQIFVTPTLGSLVTNPTTGLFGQPQV